MASQSENPVVELEFELDDPSYPFVAVSAAESCEVDLEEMVPRGDSTYAEFYSIRGTDVTTVLEMAEEHAAVTPQIVEEYDDGGIIEFIVADNCPAVGLAELGALPRKVHGENGSGRIIAELPGRYDSSDVVDAFQAEYNATLVAKRSRPEFTPLFSQRELDRALDRQLTPRQQEVLEAAFAAGYYEWPRETTGKELAEQLDISQPTLSEHLTAAERKLLSLLLERSQ